jgi:ADP-heptose:LPS heptosyltransferase
VKRALVIRLGGIGDNLIASSVLPLLAREYTVDVMAQDPQHCVFENNRHITGRLIVKKQGDIPPGDAWQQYFAERAKEYDFCVNLSHSLETKLALFKNETAFWWPEAFRRRICGHNYLEYIHDLCGVEHDFTEGPRFYPTDAEMDKAAETLEKVAPHSNETGHPLRKVIGIPISGSRIDKSWPFLPLLCARMLERLPVAIVLFGDGERDLLIAEHVQDFVKLWRGTLDHIHAAITVKGKAEWPIRRALTTLRLCDLVLTPDTGLAWGVAMHRIPKVVLVSHASVDNITKHWRNTETLHADPERVSCWPCHRLHDDPSTCRKGPDDVMPSAACMADISHEAVFAAVERGLSTEKRATLPLAAE